MWRVSSIPVLALMLGTMLKPNLPVANHPAYTGPRFGMYQDYNSYVQNLNWQYVMTPLTTVTPLVGLLGEDAELPGEDGPEGVGDVTPVYPTTLLTESWVG